jgi:hypothetical protein
VGIANAQVHNAAPRASAPLVVQSSAQASAWKTLATAISDHKAIHRQQAVDAFSTLGTRRRAVRMVEARLSDKNSAVRADAATALAEMNSRQSLPALRKTLDDESEQVRFAVARALWKMGDHSGRGFLLEVLQGEASPSTGMIRQGLDGANRKLRNPRQLALTGINEASSALLGPFSFGVKMAEQLANDKSADARALSASLLAFDHDPESVNKLLRRYTIRVRSSDWLRPKPWGSIPVQSWCPICRSSQTRTKMKSGIWQQPRFCVSPPCRIPRCSHASQNVNCLIMMCGFPHGLRGTALHGVSNLRPR